MNLPTLDPILQTLDELRESMGTKITLEQAYTIAEKLEEAQARILQRGYPGDSLDLGPIWDKIIKEVVG